MSYKRLLAIVPLLLLLTGCGSLQYDLDSVPFTVHANSAAYADSGAPFEFVSKHVLYVHGLLGEKQPRVAELLHEHLGDARAVTDFRVTAGASIWDWLGTHLSLGLVRLKTVKITGRAIR